MWNVALHCRGDKWPSSEPQPWHRNCWTQPWVIKCLLNHSHTMFCYTEGEEEKEKHAKSVFTHILELAKRWAFSVSVKRKNIRWVRLNHYWSPCRSWVKIKLYMLLWNTFHCVFPSIFCFSNRNVLCSFLGCPHMMNSPWSVCWCPKKTNTTKSFRRGGTV